MAYKIHPKLEYNVLSNEDKNELISYFKSLPLKKSIYEIVSHGDVDLLDNFLSINCTDGIIKNDSPQFMQLLFDTYHELNIKRVPIGNKVKKNILKKIIHYFYSNQEEKSAINVKVSTPVDNFNTIREDICENIRELIKLKGNIYRKKTFHYICSYLASKLNTIKKLFKKITDIDKFNSNFSSRIFPWEQIQFLLSIYVYSHQYLGEEFSGLYLCIITENGLLKHLEQFLKQLESFKIDTVCKKTQNKCNNDNGIEGTSDLCNSNKSDESSILNQRKYLCLNSRKDLQVEYSELFYDFWLVKNIYSLTIINKYLEIIICFEKKQFDENSEISFLAFERSILMLGEYSKCTPESPHLSQDVKNAISSLMPRDLQYFIKKIRDNLTHFPDFQFNGSKSISCVPESAFLNIQQDFIKFRDNFHSLLYQQKCKAVVNFVESLIKCKTLTSLKQRYPDDIFHAIVKEIEKMSGKYKGVSFALPKISLNKLKLISEESENQDYKKKIEELSNLLAGNNSMEDCKSIEIESVMGLLLTHLNYLDCVVKNTSDLYSYESYLDLLEIIVSLIKAKRYYNDSVLQQLEVALYDIIKLFPSSDEVVDEAMKLLLYIHINMNEINGITLLKRHCETVNVSNKSFSLSQTEIDNILTFIRINLTTEEEMVKFDNEVNKERHAYTRVAELVATVKELEKLHKTGNAESTDEKMKHLQILIGNSNSDLDKKILKFAQEKDFNKCFGSIKSKYKGKRRCKYEDLVRGFMKADTVIKKADLISEFLKLAVEQRGNNSHDIKKIVIKEYLSVINNKCELLEKITILINCDSRKNNIYYKANLKAAAEMIMLQILEISHKAIGGDNQSLLTMRPDILVFCGKTLRNYLAHADIVYKMFSFDSGLMLSLITEEMSNKNVEWVSFKNYLTHSVKSDFDWNMEQKYFGKQNLSLISLQEFLFTCVLNDNDKDLELCINGDSADPRGTDVYMRNALQVAFDCSSQKCFEFLVQRYKKIMLCNSAHQASKMSLSLDVSSLPRLIKLIKMIEKFSGIFCQDEVLMVENMYDYINGKFDTVSTGKQNIVDRLHIYVCCRATEAIELYCEMGLHMMSSPDLNGYYAIHWSTALGYLDICKRLLVHKIDLNQLTMFGYSPLDVAIERFQWEVMDYLMTSGAVKYNKHTDPILLAIITNQREVINSLLEHNRFINNEGHFNICLFSYALHYSDCESIATFFNYFNTLSANIVLDFLYMESKSLSNHFFKHLAYSFITNGACFLNKIDVVKFLFNFEDAKFLKNSQFRLTFNFKHLINVVKSISDDDCWDLRDCIPDIYELFKNNSLLHLACYGGKGIKAVELVSFLINNGFDINERNGDGLCPLHISILFDDIEVCTFLIDNGANIEQTTESGFTPLHLSSMHGLVKITDILLSRFANFKSRHQESLKTPLHFAASGGHDHLIELLLCANNDSLSNENTNFIDWIDSLGNSALLLAARSGHKNPVKILLEHHADISIKNIIQCNVIHEAAWSGCEDTLRLILCKMPDILKNEMINSFSEVFDKEEYFKVSDKEVAVLLKDEDKIKMKTPLFESTRTEIIKLLLENKADINLKNSLQETALHCAVALCNYDAVSILISYYNCELDPIDSWGCTPLYYAVNSNEIEIVNLFLNKDIDINKSFVNTSNAAAYLTENKLVDNTQQHPPLTYIMLSSGKGYLDLTKLLLAKGAYIDRSVWWNPLSMALANSHTETASVLLDSYSLAELSNSNVPYFHIAIELNNLVFIKKMLAKGVTPDLKNNDGYNTVHFAVIHGHLECLEIFIDHGVDVDSVCDYNNFTALHLSSLYGRTDSVRFLLKRGAKINCHGKSFETPLSLALENRQIDIAKILIQMGARTDFIGASGIISILNEILFTSNYDLIKCLFTSKKKLDCSNESVDDPHKNPIRLPRLTKLYKSLSYETLTIVSNSTKKSKIMKIKSDDDIDRIKKCNPYFNGMTPLHYCSLTQDIKMAEFLLENGANVNAVTLIGQTPLHYAMSKGKIDMISLLLRYNALIDNLTNLHS